MLQLASSLAGAPDQLRDLALDAALVLDRDAQRRIRTERGHMHPRIAELASFIAVERVALESAFEAVPEGWRERRSSADSWTAAEVVNHLAKVESGIARLVGRRTEKARLAGLGPETSVSSVLGSLDHGLFGGPSKFVAPEVVRPDVDTAAHDAIVALKQSRLELNAALTAVDGLALGEIVHTHPALGDLDLYQWVLSVGLHERHHARQLGVIADWSRTAGASALYGGGPRRKLMDDE